MPALDHSKYSALYPLKAIRNEKDYKDALNSMEMVFDETDGDLGEYAETLNILIEYYESQQWVKDSSDDSPILNKIGKLGETDSFQVTKHLRNFLML